MLPQGGLILGGQVTRCLMTGWDAPQAEESNGQQYLVLPFKFEVLINTAMSTYSV